MNCDQFSILIDRHLAGSLNAAEEQQLRDHLNSCLSCRLALQMREDGLSLDEDREVPASFSSAWRKAVLEEEAKTMEPKEDRKIIRPSFRFRRWMAVAAAFLLVVGGTLATRNRLPVSQRNYASYEDDYAQSGLGGAFGRSVQPEASPMEAAPKKMMAAPAADGAAPAEAREAKVIRTIGLSIQTRAFTEDLDKVSAAILAQGGYVEYSDVSAASATRRSATINARIPREKLDSFLQAIEGVGQLSNKTESQEDVSERYYDVDTRLKTQESKMERLQSLLLQAKTVEDILNIETQIADTQYTIDSLRGSLRGMDSKVSYSTVRISLQEQSIPVKPESPSILQRLGDAIADAFGEFVLFLQDLLFFVIAILPYLVVIAVLIIVARIILKRRKNKK